MKRQEQTQASTLPPISAGEDFNARVGLKRRPLLWAMFAAILLFYLLLLTKNYYWDGIFFAQTIEDAPKLNATLLHPNHLFYNVLGFLVYRLTLSVGLELRAVEVLQIINCLVSAASAYLFFRILLACFKSIYLSACLTLVFAFSAVWWKFSTDADSYILSVFFLLVSFYLILPGRRPRPFLLSGAHTLSMLFHQLALFFFPVALLGIYFQAQPQPKKQRVTLLLKYSLTTFLITFTLFYYSFYLVTGTLAFKPFIRWVTTFSPENGFTFDAWDNLTYSLRGHWRLFLGGRVSFLRDLRGPWIISLVIVLLMLLASLFFKLIRHFGELKKSLRSTARVEGQSRSLRLLCAVWIAFYLIFLFFFIPQNTFYRLFYLPAIILFGGTFLAPFEMSQSHTRRFRALLFAAIVFVANLTFSAYPYAQVRANPPLAMALALNKALPPGTIIYFAKWNSDNSLFRYFNPTTIWRQVGPENLEKEAQDLSTGGSSAWMETTLIERYLSTPEGARWIEAHTIKRPEFELVNDKYKLRFYQIKLDSFSLAP